MHELMMIHGLISYDNRMASFNVYHACPHLYEETNLCSIYDQNRPKICREYMCPKAQGKTLPIEIRADFIDQERESLLMGELRGIIE